MIASWARLATLSCLAACSGLAAAVGDVPLRTGALPGPASGYAARLAAGKAVDLIVEFDATAADQAAQAARARAGLRQDDAAVVAARAARYRSTKAAVEQALAGSGAAPVRDFPHLPLALWHFSAPGALARLRAQPAFRGVSEDRRVTPVATPSDLALIQQPAAAAAGATGAGTTVVVIDAGIDLTNPAFGTCPTYGVAGCRVIYDTDYYPGSGTDVTHGTNVAGIVAEIATGARIAMLNVFNGSSASSSDILSAIDWAIANQAADNIVAINMSLGDGGDNAAACASTPANINPLQTAIATAAAAGIQSVAASGNNAFAGGINFPACTPGVISVGAVYDANIGGVSYSGVPCTDTATAVDQVTCFTNMATYLSLLAPGAAVTAAGITEYGTSQATPHVSGVMAALRARYPKEPLTQALARLTLTGTLDSRGGISVPRINEDAAYTLGAQLELSGTGPATATLNGTAQYVLNVKNAGPLIATDVVVTDELPALAVFVSASGCSASGATVSCPIASLAAGATTSFTINIRWSGSGAVYDSATAAADQANPAPLSATVAFGTPPAESATVPLPPWCLVLLVGMLAVGGFRAAPRWRPGAANAAVTDV